MYALLFAPLDSNMMAENETCRVVTHDLVTVQKLHFMEDWWPIAPGWQGRDEEAVPDVVVEDCAGQSTVAHLSLTEETG